MLNFYAYMNYHLIKQGYVTMYEVPAEVIINLLRSFLQERLLEKEEIDIFSLYSKFYQVAQDKKEVETIIHFLLGYISDLQGFAVAWYINETEEPTFTYNKHYPNTIDGLNTTINIDYEKVFAYVLNTALDLKEKREEGIRR